MARPRSVPVREALRKTFTASMISTLARVSGAFQRLRKIEPVALFWTLVLGFGAGRVRTIAGLRRAYEKETGTRLVPSVFYDRFNAGLVKMMAMAIEEGLKLFAGVPPALQGTLKAFKDVILTDSTVVRLNDLLQAEYPACRTNHTLAALKMHAVISVMGKGNNSLKVTPERRHDGPVFQVGPWIKGKLLLFDLGYFSYRLFASIERNGGYFISRLKSNVDPIIVADNGPRRRGRRRLAGDSLRSAIQYLQRDTVDVMVTIRYRKRAYGGRKTGKLADQCLRVVGVRDEDTREWHLYITNLPVDRLAAREIGQLYRARWMVELLFRELKSSYRMQDLPSGNKHVVLTLLYAAVLTLVVSRQLLGVVQKKLGSSADRVTLERWAVVFAEVAGRLLEVILSPPRLTGYTERRVAAFLMHEAVDPNRARPSLLESLGTPRGSDRRKAA